MANAGSVKLGVCYLKFKGVDLGYTQGGVKVTYKAEVQEKTVDQEDAPIGSVVKSQSFDVEVPLAEYDLSRLVEILPGATLITDPVDSTKKKLVLSGKAGIDTFARKGELVITSADGDPNDTITLHNAVPDAQLDFSFSKDNVRVYKINFKALAGDTGYVSFGNPTAYGIFGLKTASGKVADTVIIQGSGFTVGGTKPTITFDGTEVLAADITITSDTTITVAKLGAATATGLCDVVITSTEPAEVTTLADAYTVLAA